MLGQFFGEAAAQKRYWEHAANHICNLLAWITPVSYAGDLQDYARVNGYDFVLGIKQVDPQLENMWNKPGKCLAFDFSSMSTYKSSMCT